MSEIQAIPRWWQGWGGGTPRGLLARAALIALAYAAARAAGLAEYTSFLSGIAPGGGMPGSRILALGSAYLALHFGCVIVAPILAIGSVILWVMPRKAPEAAEKNGGAP